MIKRYVLTSDIHGGVVELVDKLNSYDYIPEETAVIILGDVGLNYYLNNSDRRRKEYLQDSGYTFYCLRGNHEERPQNVPGHYLVPDGEVNNDVWIHPDYPNIRYLVDGNIYMFDNFTCLAIGGAYSIDKYYRLANGYKWFPEEQLSEEEMYKIAAKVKGIKVDFVLTHTCPYKFMSRDLFLSVVDQSTVDNTMEHWLEDIMGTFTWFVWLWGHYHDDRLVRPNMEMLYEKVYDINEIYERHYTCDYRFFKKDPNFYMIDNEYAWRLKEEKEWT